MSAPACPLLQNLVDELKSELSGNFEKVVLGLLMPSPVYDAYELKNAIKVRGRLVRCKDVLT